VAGTSATSMAYRSDSCMMNKGLHCWLFLALRVTKFRSEVQVDDAYFCAIKWLSPTKRFIDCSTKFIGGHEDVCAGVLTTRTAQQWKQIMHSRSLFGGILVCNNQSINH